MEPSNRIRVSGAALKRSASARITFAAVDDPSDDVVYAQRRANFARAKSNSKLLESAETPIPLASVEEFIQKLQKGENTVESSTFRERRLSTSQRIASNKDHVEGGEVSEVVAAVSKLPQVVSSVMYTCTEMGEELVNGPPFTQECLGTFSCHGIEPGNHGVHDKINQDRGCLVYPFNKSTDEMLFLVLDGHGEQGDLVSEFAMQQVLIL